MYGCSRLEVLRLSSFADLGTLELHGSSSARAPAQNPGSYQMRKWFEGTRTLMNILGKPNILVSMI